MKIQNTLAILLVTNILIVNANPNSVLLVYPTYDEDFEIIMPDKVFLSSAAKAYKDGYNKLSLTYFKKAAAFGNSKAFKYIGLMYIKSIGVERDWAKAYAWIRLAAQDNTKEHVDLQKTIYAKLTQKEIRKSKIFFDVIKLDYGSHAALVRRDKWVRRNKKNSFILGSRTGSLALSGKVKTYKSIGDAQKGNVAKVHLEENLRVFNSFVVDFNYGIVTGGEIKAKNN